MKASTPLLICFLLLHIIVRSQSVMPDVVATSGDFYSNSSGQVQWTLGEVMVETYSNSNYNISQGFHQSFLTGTGINSFTASSLNIFPNPTSQSVSVTFSRSGETYLVSLTDITGKILQSKKHSNADQMLQFDLENYSNGVYILKVSGEETNFNQCYRIIKTN
jgi:hypothetical protein